MRLIIRPNLYFYYIHLQRTPWKKLWYSLFKFFFLLSLMNYNLLFTIRINNFSDSDDNKIKLKRIQFRVDVHWCLPHSTVILKEYFKNIPLKSCNIAIIFIKLLERFLKYCKNLAMSAQNIINVMLLQYWYFILILL